MYKTIKIRVHTTKEQKHHLYQYEEVYHKELDALCHQLHQHPTQSRYRQLSFTNQIHPGNRWLLYQQARHRYQREIEGKTTCFHKSSSWHPSACKIKQDTVQLIYGPAFAYRQDTVILCPKDKELLYLQLYKVIRIDLMHDEMFWYANFLVNIPEDS